MLNKGDRITAITSFKGKPVKQKWCLSSKRLKCFMKITKLFIILIPVLGSNQVAADDAIQFHDIATESSSGINYQRYPSLRNAIWEDAKTRPDFLQEQFPLFPLLPLKSRGAPGVAILDYDNDKDLDIYVTNGPGQANSLFTNQIRETGNLSFIDTAISAGVAAINSDSSGVCYGDIDNDGDADLYLLSVGAPNHLFLNNGDGSFIDITQAAGVGGGAQYPSGCSLGDVNGDGLLDIVVANTMITWDHSIAVVSEPFSENVHNQLFINQGHNEFLNASKSSGIEILAGFPAQAEGAAGLTLAIAMVDYDLDGDTDIIMVDDQGAVPDSTTGGVDRGLIHIMNNDGNGKFMDMSVVANTNIPGAWMGLSFGDLNSDGNMDMFVSSAGDYMRTFSPTNLYVLGSYASKWFLGQADNTFIDPGLGELVSTAFGWGTAMTDYDNDGDTDIIYHGGLDVIAFVDATNPGLMLQNDGSGKFVYDTTALSLSTNHSRRNVQGVAVGDLNLDGFTDIASVSNFNMQEPLPLFSFPTKWGSTVDDTAFYYSHFLFSPDNELIWNGVELDNGTLSVEINNAANENGWAKVTLMGSVGLLKRGKVNRDGVGAVVKFTPDNGKTVMRPIIAGASHASQSSLTARFGLGEEAEHGMVEVLWPGGVKNRLYGLSNQEHFIFPEIPCSYAADWPKQGDYFRCVTKSLTKLKQSGVITKRQLRRLLFSAVIAYAEEQNDERD